MTTNPQADALRGECQKTVTAVRQGLAALEQATEQKTIETVLVPLDDLRRELDGASGKAALLRSVHPDAQVREVAETCESDLKLVATDLSLSRPIYDALQVVALDDADEATRHYVKTVLRDFRRAGVDRDQETRTAIRALEQELVTIGQEFSRNIREDVRSIALPPEALQGLPDDFVQSHTPGEDGQVRITTDMPDYFPFMTYAERDDLRLSLYKAFRNRGWPKNDLVLNRLLEKRQELASRLGYRSWASYATEDKMIQDETRAQRFIDQVANLASERSRGDYEALLGQIKRAAPSATEVGDWQKAYAEELVRRERYAFDSKAVRPYFAFDRVKQGLLDLTAELFGVTFAKVDRPVWHPSVEAYEMRQGEQVLGRFFFDLHPRADKYQHAAVFPIQVGVEGKQLPEAALVCNFPGGDGGPGYMDHDSVSTFFHEFGHLMHHLFASRTRWAGVNGIATEWDFVEAPSQLLEEWTFEPAVLRRIGRNDQGQPIPDELIEGLRRARDFGKGLVISQQMFYAALALAYYSREPRLDTTEVLKELQKRYTPFRYVDDTHFQTTFGHLDGYSSNYYTYMWSLVIAKDLFAQIQSAGMLSPEVIQEYRRKILEPGGSRSAADLIRDFLGRDFDFGAFSRWVQQQ